MAGTAEGAAKATAARIAAAARRRAAAVGQSQARHLPVVGLTDAGPSGDVADVAGPFPAVAVSAQAVAGLLPEAVDVIGKVLRGTLRVTPAVRVQTALKVVELSAKPGAIPAAPAGMPEALAALSKAFALRARTLDAVTLEPVEQSKT